ncbi:MAG: hypothetical protein FWE61_04830 [Micrococcales bacterium]|nr:hypothetical protein [Micrococcales bacterium]
MSRNTVLLHPGKNHPPHPSNGEAMSQPPADTTPGWGSPAPPPAWASPSGTPVDEPDPGVPPPPGYGPGAPTYAPAPVPGQWRPPTLQPGIIPLRPLGLGELLDGTMKAVRFNPKVTFGLTATVITVCVTLATLVTAYLAGFFMKQLRDLAGYGADEDALLLITLSQYSTMPLLYIATPLLNGLLIVAVSKAVLGQKVSVGEVVRSRRIWAVLGFSMLVMAASTATVTVLVVGVVVLASLGTAGVVAGVVIAILGAVALVVGSVWLMIRTLLVPPALMLEDKPFWQTVRRAWKLTYKSFWRLTGIYLLVWVILGLLSSVVSVPLTIVSMVLAMTGFTWVSLVVNAMNLVLAYTITVAFEAVVVALLYIDVRMRREGLDLELARAAAGAPQQ